MPSLFSRRASAPGLLAALCLLAALPSSLHSASSAAPANRTPYITGRPAQLAHAALVAAVGQSPLQAVEPALASVTTRLQFGKAKTDPVRVLMIGDSMTVGDFGESLEEFLLRRTYGRAALYASCGSSPESWLAGEPEFITKCGYRAYSPLKKKDFTDFTDGHKPNPRVTPKLENLLAYHTPSIVIVQLGTNWMDGLESKSFAAEEPKYRAILEKFAAPLTAARSVKQVIWITPPDSSRYSPKTERNVEELIRAAAQRHHYLLVDSKRMTGYVPGHTGGDGVHYRKEDACAWAKKVIADPDFQRGLQAKLR
jgi:hypothetical protein